MLNLFIVLKGGISPKFSVPFKGFSESSSKLSFVNTFIGAGHKILSLPAEFHFFHFKRTKEKFKSYSRAENKSPAWAKQSGRLGILAQHHKSFAFSLVEMLMALLVASLLLAALAPVMTKKFSENVSVFGAGSGGGRAPAGMKCWNWEAKDLNELNQRVVKDFQLDEIWYANFILASGGGGGAGATVSSEENDTMDINTTNATTNGIKITKDMADFEITSLIGGGGGAGGGAAVFSGSTCSGSPSVEKCECMGQKFDSKNNLCVSDNLGSKSRSNAISACSALSPSNKWSVPTTSQLSNWSTLYSDFGITTGQTVWSQTTGQGDCISNNYECYCKGKHRTGRATQEACCTSECSWGSQAPSSLSCSCTMVCTGGSYSDSTSGQSSCSACYNRLVEAANGADGYGGMCTRSGFGSYSRYQGCSCSPGSSGNTCASTVSRSCNSYYTNYYYYQLSGSSWSQNYETAGTGSRSTYCVYSDSGDVDGSRFYSLSGGGGGGAPAIQNNNFNSNIKTIFNQKIKDNVDGYIVLEKGEGGKGGDGAGSKNQKAGNGSSGNPSCVAIYDSSRKIQYRICALGGKGGYGADATKTDSSTSGWGAAGGETPTTNSCVAIDYSSNSSGVQTPFDCSDKGKGAGPGGASTSNPTTGGLGGASVLNSITVSNNGKDGITASSANYGAGGGGGSAIKTGTGSSASLSFGDGGDGSDGYIKLSFKHKYDGAGGGGGSAGTVAVVNNIYVGKTAACTFKIGQGGSGGGIGADGTDGGNTSVQCSNDSTVYEVYGGLKGKKGTSAASAGQISLGGLGGENPKITYVESIAKLVAKNDAKAYIGLNGTNGGFNDPNNSNYTNYIQGTKSSGGRGGTSGPGKKGTCGGLLNDVVCSTSSDDEPTVSALNALGFTYKDILEPTSKSISQATPTYGESSAGGGGGAW